jgi:hypothetical protein
MKTRWSLFELRLVALIGLMLLVAACSAESGAIPSGSNPPPTATPSRLLVTSPVPVPEVVCDTSLLNPSPSLTCGPALAAALTMLGPVHRAIVREEFRWGGLCPPGAPCVAPLGDQGIVIIDFATGPPLFVYVSSAPSGAVVASSPAPYPSGY